MLQGNLKEKKLKHEKMTRPIDLKLDKNKKLRCLHCDKQGSFGEKRFKRNEARQIKCIQLQRFIT